MQTSDLKEPFTAYIQPSYNLINNDSAVFGKVGYTHADLEISIKSN
jgi:hypothetical protein